MVLDRVPDVLPRLRLAVQPPSGAFARIHCDLVRPGAFERLAPAEFGRAGLHQRLPQEARELPHTEVFRKREECGLAQHVAEHRGPNDEPAVPRPAHQRHDRACRVLDDEREGPRDVSVVKRLDPFRGGCCCLRSRS